MKAYYALPVRRHTPALAIVATLLFGTMPALAQDVPPPPSGPAAQADEVIVTAPRNGEPGFQEADEYHRQEYARLNAKFGKPPAAEPQGDAVLSRAGTMASPNNRELANMRETISEAPRLRDTFADN